jgi:hypothetical protein
VTEPAPIEIENYLREESVKAASAKTKAAMLRQFRVLADDRYSLTVPELGIVVEISRLRRERSELIGELSVRCELSGAQTVNGGSLSIADLNLSSARARIDRAKLLSGRANISNFDWAGLVEEFCQRVLDADRLGQPPVDLRELPRPSSEDDSHDILGLSLPRHHPTILFGDGGTGKSYIALYAAGRIVEMSASVALFDWELSGEDHRERLELLFPDGMPRVLYVRCERPLVYEVDRLRRIVRDNEVGYAVYDSVAFAADGPPESAEVAGRYFRAARQIGCGSLHVAHVNKGENADKKPFGSAFWHNGARSTWYAKLAEESAGTDSLRVGLFHRKSNLGRLRPAVGLSLTFDAGQTLIRRVDVADTPDLAEQLSVRQRMEHLLRRGPMSVTQIAEELEIEVNTITQTVNRHVKKGRTFIILEGQNTNRKIGLLHRDSLS